MCFRDVRKQMFAFDSRQSLANRWPRLVACSRSVLCEHPAMIKLKPTILVRVPDGASNNRTTRRDQQRGHFKRLELPCAYMNRSDEVFRPLPRTLNLAFGQFVRIYC